MASVQSKQGKKAQEGGDDQSLVADAQLQSIDCDANIKLYPNIHRVRIHSYDHSTAAYHPTARSHSLTILHFAHFRLNSVAMALHDGVLGGNLFVSVMYVISGVVGFGGGVPINVSTLKAMLAGAGMGSKSKPIVRFVYTANITGLALYSLVLASVFTFLPLYAASTTESPNESVVVPALLVLRNMSVFFYFIFLGKVGQYTSLKVREIITQRSTAGKSGKSSSAADVKMELLLNKLDRSTQETKKKGFVIGIIYGVFCLPWMHPYQVGGGYSFNPL
jgi:hypothetical protein